MFLNFGVHLDQNQVLAQNCFQRHLVLQLARVLFPATPAGAVGEVAVEDGGGVHLREEFA